jgi:DnaJ-class molecular chaperone
LDEVRDHWERITFSYNVLLDNKKRARYDRNSALDNPRAAFGRMALSVLAWGAGNVGNMLLSLATHAVSQATHSNITVNVPEQKSRLGIEESLTQLNTSRVEVED